MDILKRIFGNNKKRSFLDEDGFARLPTEAMDTILGGRPADPAAAAFDLPADLTATRTNLTNYSHPENRH
ncbi:hypothetical protein [Spirosoma koreense]